MLYDKRWDKKVEQESDPFTLGTTMVWEEDYTVIQWRDTHGRWVAIKVLKRDAPRLLFEWIQHGFPTPASQD